MLFSPVAIASMFSLHSVSVPASCSVLKSINISNSGSDDAMSFPSQLNILPRVGVMAVLSSFTRSDTSSQNLRSAVIIYSALPSMASVTAIMMITRHEKRKGVFLWSNFVLLIILVRVYYCSGMLIM